MQRLVSTLLLSALAACGSIAEHRVRAVITSPSYEMPVDLWVHDRNNASASYLVQWDSLLWPVDAVVSLYWGCRALGDPDLEIRYGPAGVLLSVLLPFCSTRFPASATNLDQSTPAKWKGLTLPNPDLLQVTDEEVERWLAGELSLPTLAARGIGESYLRYIRRHEAWSDFRRAQQVVFDVLDGRVPVSQAGELELRQDPQ